METNKNKYQYLAVLQRWVEGCGWCDECFYDVRDREQMSDARNDLRDYRKYERDPFRIIHRRVPNDGRQIHA